MEQLVDLDVNVTISQELRDIVSQRRRPLQVNARYDRARQTRPKTDKGRYSTDTPAWSPIILRRDANRPLRFDGMLLIGFGGLLRLGDFGCQHSVHLYVDAQVGYILALHLGVPEGAPFRPLYRSFVVTFPQLTDEVARWCQDIASVAQEFSPTSNHTTTHHDVRDALNAMTLHCFRFEQFSQ